MPGTPPTSEWLDTLRGWEGSGVAAEAAATHRDFTAFNDCVRRGRRQFRGLRRHLDAPANAARDAAMIDALHAGAAAWRRIPALIAVWREELRQQMDCRARSRAVGRSYAAARAVTGSTLSLVSAPGGAELQRNGSDSGAEGSP